MLDRWPWAAQIIAAIFAVAPPVFFVLEYWSHERIMKPLLPVPGTVGTNQMYDPEDKALLDQTKTYQDNVGKIWIAITAGLAYLYIGEAAKVDKPVTTLDRSQRIVCSQNGAGFDCEIEAKK